MKLICGFGKMEINPPIGAKLGGYSNSRPNEGVHDSLFSRVLFFNRGKEKFLLIVLDLLSVDRYYVNSIRKKIADRFGIEKSNILLHATHTHSGPAEISFSPHLWGGFNYDLVQSQHKNILKSVEMAIHNSGPCIVKFGVGNVEGIATNRNNPDFKLDNKVQVIHFKKSTGKDIVLFHFAVHPTVLHEDNLLVSADLPGAAIQELERHFDADAIFANGPCADISTRFTRKESSFIEVERMGKLLANEVKRIIDNKKMEQIYIDQLFAKEQIIKLSIGNFKMEEEFKQLYLKLEMLLKKSVQSEESDFKITEIQRKLEGIGDFLKISKKLKKSTKLITSVQIIVIGKIIFGSFPGEVFYESGKDVAENVPTNYRIILLGNSNDYIGYIVPKSCYNSGTYEDKMTFLKKDSDEKIKCSLKKLLFSIKR